MRHVVAGLLLLAVVRQVIISSSIPKLERLSAASVSVGASVTLFGQNFAPAGMSAGTVTVNGVAATVTNWVDNAVTIIVPTTTTGLVLIRRADTALSNTLTLTITTVTGDCPTTDIKTVKTSGGDFTTIAACLNAGHNCQVDAGTWAGGTVTTSGTPTHYDTVFAAAGADQLVVMSSQINFGAQSYLQIGCSGGGLFFSGVAVTGGGNLNAHHIKYIGNKFDNFSTDFIIALSVFSQHTLVDNNTFGPTLHDDDVDIFNWYVVLRNNVAKGITQIADHPDFCQTYCTATTRGAIFVLLENNYAHDCVGPDCHFFQFNNNGCDSAGDASPNDPEHNWIIRENVVANMQSAMYSFQDNAAGVTQWSQFASYNNTQDTVYPSNNYTECIGCAGSPGRPVLQAFSKNEICYKCGAAAAFAFMFPTGTTLKNGLLYFPGSTITASGNLSTCVASGNCLINQDPLFTNQAAGDYTLQNGSPGLDSGIAPTTVAAGDSGFGTSLVVNDAYAFQDATWVDGIQADCVSVKTVGNHVCISSIDYTTNTITLASDPGARSAGDAVWLYSDSAGRVVLKGTAPDRGAKEK
jgi:hypothetical protein